MPDVTVLNVALHGRVIGTLTHFAGDRSLFAFTDDYIADPDRPTLGLFFKDALGTLRTDFRPVQKKVMPFFSNLLPEGPLRKYLAGLAGVHEEREFLLLRALGQDLPGAVTLSPAGDGVVWPGAMREAMTPAELLANDMLRFSLAGVQLKFSATRHALGGLSLPVSGVGGDWIVKPPSPDYLGLPENEFSMMRLATLLGLDVPPIDLVDIAAVSGLPDVGIGRGDTAFIIKRFDRLADGGRVHIEDFAQVFGVYSEDKYKKASMRNLATVIAAEGTEADVREFVRRVVFNTLIGNGDMHLKNWSLIYPDRRSAALAPAYDFVSTIAYIPNDGFALNYSRRRAFQALDKDELAHLAAKAALPERGLVETARETAADFLMLWEQEKHSLPMFDAVRQAVDALLPTLPLVKGI